MIRGGGIGNAVCGEADTADGRTAAANARSATYLPVDGSLVSYTVTATNTSDTTKKTSLELDPGETEFEIRLIEGTYTLSVEGFLGEGESRKKILRGTYRNAATNSTVTIDKEHPNPQVGKIYVNPFFDEGGTGTVSLKMNLSGCKIKSVKAVWKKQGADGTEKTATFDKGGSVLTEIFFGGLQSESEGYAFAFSESESTADIPSGIYEVAFSFYSDKTQQDEVHKLFSCTHSLNVYQNLTAGWWKSSTAGTTYISDGKFTLTQEIINGYIRHKFYVDQSKKATSLNEGTWYAPFDSVRTAVEKIRIINDGEPFTVILLSDDTDESTASYTSGKMSYIDIVNTSLPLAVTILGKDDDDNDTLRTINAARDADADITGRVMYIGDNAEVTLKNVKITGGYSKNNFGGGIYNAGTLTIIGGTIAGNKSDNSGGGIYNSGTLELSDVTITGGNGSSGGGIFNDNATLTMTGGAITECNSASAYTTSGNGGGIYSRGTTSTLNLSGITVSGCTATQNGGGIYITDGTLSLDGCMIGGDSESDGNSAKQGGGISLFDGTLTFTGSTTTIKNCTATTFGGGVYASGGTLILENGTITDCTTSSYGGGVYVKTGTLTVTGGTIENCTSNSSGGGIYNDGGTATITDCTVKSCRTTSPYGNTGGGGIYNAGTLTVSGGSITLCTSGYAGGGINSSGTTSQLTVQNVTVSKCTAELYGGGIYNVTPSAMIEGCIITGCATTGQSSSAQGGGIRTAGDTVTIKNCTIGGSGTGEGNKGYSGGGIYNTGILTISGGTILGNTATNHGGGIWNNAADKSITLDEVTITGNTAATNGGGVYNYCTVAGKYPALIVNSGEISGNAAKKGGGIYSDGHVTVDGGMIFDNTATEKGGDIFHYGTELTLKGTAFVKDIHIGGKSCYITADASLALAAGKTVCATISLDDGEYTADRQVLQAADGGAITGDICEKFAVAQDPNGIEWSVTPDGTGTKGVLRNSTLYVRGAGAGWYTENPDYTASAGSDTNSGSKSAPFATIRKAVEKVLAMNDGATEYTIWVDGTITDSAAGANGMGDISPASTLNLKIQSMSETTHATLDAQNNGRVMNISANAAVTLKNVNITNGNTADNGGGISNSGTLTVTGGTISDCTAVPTDASDSEQGRGGAIFNNTNGTLELDGTAISDCTAGNGGGIYNNEGTFAITGGSITNCTTDGGDNVNIHHGGGIYNTVSDASLVSTISNCPITDCRAMSSTANSQYGWGGGICNNAGTLELTNVDITGGNDIINKDAFFGGGIYVYSGAALTMTGGTIKDCVSYSGGGIYVYASGTIRDTLTCTDVKVTNCTATSGGGGIFNSGASTTLTNCTITICKTLRDTYTGSSNGDFGGGINNRGGVLTLSGGSITGCSSVMGGGIRNSRECVITDGAEISHNNAEGGTDAGGNCGGGIYNSSKLTLENGTVSDNEAVLWGGGIYIKNGTLTMTGGTVSKNKAKAGGGVSLKSGTFTIEGGEISGNTSTGTGGGVYSSDTLIMKGGTISSNTATTDGGGVYVNSGTFTMSDGTIGGNTAAGNGGGVLTVGTFTMEGGTITSNTAASGGGGVSVIIDGTFTMTNGTISGNTATANGGGVFVPGTFTMEGGSITSNTAASGGGVYKHSIGTFNANGGTVSGNTPDQVYNMP